MDAILSKWACENKPALSCPETALYVCKHTFLMQGKPQHVVEVLQMDTKVYAGSKKCTNSSWNLLVSKAQDTALWLSTWHFHHKFRCRNVKTFHQVHKLRILVKPKFDTRPYYPGRLTFYLENFLLSALIHLLPCAWPSLKRPAIFQPTWLDSERENARLVKRHRLQCHLKRLTRFQNMSGRSTQRYRGFNPWKGERIIQNCKSKIKTSSSWEHDVRTEFWDREAPSPLNSPNQKYAQ